MTITPNWLESPAKVELTQGELVILVPMLARELNRTPIEADYLNRVDALIAKLHAAFRGPKS